MITLDTVRDIMKIIESYQGSMSMSALISSIPYPPEVTAEVIEFLQAVRPVQVAAVAVAVIDDGEPLNLMDELQYNYKVAKRVLETTLVNGRTIDAEETRKSLATISKFMEQALKLQERLFNAQQIQLFQDSVLEVLNEVDPVIRDNVLKRLL